MIPIITSNISTKTTTSSTISNGNKTPVKEKENPVMIDNNSVLLSALENELERDDSELSTPCVSHKNSLSLSGSNINSD